VATSKRQHITPVLAELHCLPVAARIDFKIATITFNYTHVNCFSCVDRRDRSGQAITTYSTFHNHALHSYSGVLHTLPLVSGMHSLIQSPMISISLHLFLNPDLKFSCTRVPTT